MKLGAPVGRYYWSCMSRIPKKSTANDTGDDEPYQDTEYVESNEDSYQSFDDYDDDEVVKDLSLWPDCLCVLN